jgi:hypothetical protein
MQQRTLKTKKKIAENFVLLNLLAEFLNILTLKIKIYSLF